MKEENKKKLRSFLTASSIILSLILVSLIVYGIFVEVPISIALDKKYGQVTTIDITELSDNVVATIEEQEDLEKGIEEMSLNPESEKKESTNELTQASVQNNESSNVVNESNSNAPKVNPSDPAEVTSEGNNSEDIAVKEKFKISILVTNLGTNEELTKLALNLPGSFTLGFSAYTTSLKNLFDSSIEKGFETYVYLPFEPKDYPISDPGPYAILQRNLPEKNINITNGILSEFEGVKGIYASPREVFSEKQDKFIPIFDLLENKGLNVILGRDLYSEDTPYLMRLDKILSSNVVIDSVADEAIIWENIRKLENVARKYGFASGYVNSYPISLKILKQWSQSLTNGEFEIVPSSKLLEMKIKKEE
jgi:polysaccharide deacetylase 2 family uncharacterized protein YibQ